MEPIISPWVVYLLGVMGNLRILLLALFVALCCRIVFCSIWWIGESSNGSKEEAEKFKVCSKRSLIFAIVLFTLWAFVPNRNTLIGMVVTKNITYDRVDKTAEVGKQLHQAFKKDILELIDKLNNSGQEKENKAGKRE